VAFNGEVPFIRPKRLKREKDFSCDKTRLFTSIFKGKKRMQIQFSDKYLKATWLTDVEGYSVENRTIVVNLGNDNAYIMAPPNKPLHPRTSALLKGVTIKGGSSLLAIEILSEDNIGGIVLDSQWHQLGELTDYPKDVPLWKSPQLSVGTVVFDPACVIGKSAEPCECNFRSYDVKVNVWFTPAKTHCLIHNEHKFLEYHTQIYGTGRMQKFHSNSFSSLYQEVIMSPGYTHAPFATLDTDGRFTYPWHQYYADTDCIWAAIEFHP
jgi:hypothetical protein